MTIGRTVAKRLLQFILPASVSVGTLIGVLVWPGTTEQVINSVTGNPVPAFEIGFAAVYATLACSATVRKEWVPGAAYLAATGLALGLAACASAIH